MAHFFYGFGSMASQRKEILSKVSELSRQIAESEGLELVEAEWKGALRGGVLRVYIDKPTGITHADCECVSHQLSAALDVEDLVPANYTLEVSSPGLDRKLSKPGDFRRFEGRKAKVRMRGALEGNRTVTGRIEGSSQDGVSLRIANGEELEIPFADIELARLVIEI